VGRAGEGRIGARVSAVDIPATGSVIDTERERSRRFNKGAAVREDEWRKVSSGSGEESEKR
jgi:hypothetical protein